MRASVTVERKLRAGGILLVDKPGGKTSHDVVAIVRKCVRPFRVGHTGTLDPLASGLLILCVGDATRIAAFIEAEYKRYQGVALLGMQTDTQDVTGTVTAQASTENLDAERVRDVARSFIGFTEQRPPAFSAVKVGGVRAYKLARRQEEVVTKPRRIELKRFDITRVRLPRVEFTVECSKGTYIRTLCHDLGVALGVGGCLESLTRLAIGRFELADAKPLAELTTKELIMQSLLPASEALSHVPGIVCTEEQAKRVAHGMTLAVTGQIESPASEDAWVRAMSGGAELLAVGVLSRAGDAVLFHPKKVFTGN
jgi:tRNA pseudouridine55 synthase